MSNDLMQLVGAWLSNSWNVMTSFIFPGTNLSLAVVLLGAFLAVVSVRMIVKVFDLAQTGEQRGGNNGEIKISEDRRLDVL